MGVFYKWSNSRVSERDVSELDLGWVSPEVSGKDFGVNVNISAYTYPNTEEKWKRWDLETAVNVFTKNLPLDFNLYSAANFAEGDLSWLFKLSGKKTFEVDKNKFSLGGYLVYSDHYYSDDSGFSHAVASCELSKPIRKNLDVYVNVALQEKLKSFGGKVDDEVVGGVGFRYKFR